MSSMIWGLLALTCALETLGSRSRHLQLWQINKQKVCENTWSPCEGNKVFVKYPAQGRVLTPNPPLRTPLTHDVTPNSQLKKNF